LKLAIVRYDVEENIGSLYKESKFYLQ